MSLLKRLFGGGAAPKEAPEAYNGFRIFVEPIREPSGFRVAARIEKEVDGQTLTHQLIRADVCDSADQAREISLTKARLLIDDKGEALFD